MAQSRTALVYPLRRYQVAVTYYESTHTTPPSALPGPFRHQVLVTARDEAEARTLGRGEFEFVVLRAARVCIIEGAEIVADDGVACWRCADCGATMAEPSDHRCPPSKPRAGPEDITQELPLLKG